MDATEFRDAGHGLIERLAGYFESLEPGDADLFPDLPLFPRVDPAVLDRIFDEPLPQEPVPIAQVLKEVEEKLLPYVSHVSHPGYFGLITPTPTPAGILGDLLASALNQNVGVYSAAPSATALERRTVRWLTDLAGYGPEAGGNLTSGGTLANLIGIKLARDWGSGDDAQENGVSGRWAVYTSEERHVSVDKAVDGVGLGRRALRALPTEDDFTLSLPALERAIAGDRTAGIRPLAIVAMGGSTNTGAVDPLHRLREIADRERMWLHVDAAYGGGMLLSREHPGLLDGLALADSITMDPHKWFYAPLDAGAILVRDSRRLTDSYGLAPAYLTDETDAGGARYNYYVHGFEQSRRFRGLKVWMSFKRYGTTTLGAWIDANVAHARRLYDLAAAHPDFEPAVRPRMSAVCLRYRPAGLDEAASRRLHARVVRRIEEGGRFWISTTVLKEKGWFRVNPVNFRTRTEHVERLFEELVRECERER
jgi:aromatic-L-amino-acid decarboxylase